MKEEYIIQKKLANSLCPYMLSASELNKTTDYVIYHWYNYAKEIASALGGVGIGTAIAQFMASPNAVLSTSAAIYGTGGMLFFAAIGYLRNRAGREDVVQKIISQKKLMRQFKVIAININVALEVITAKEALEKLIVIQQETITIVNNAIQDGVWPYAGVKPTVIENARQKAEELISNFHPEWLSAKAGDEMDMLPDQN